jgi:putative ABC transport system permease protein
MLSLGGGFLGLIIGTMLVNVTAMWMKLGNLVSPIAVAMSVVFSMMIGIVFGVYPARKAAQLNPIDALRYE